MDRWDCGHSFEFSFSQSTGQPKTSTTSYSRVNKRHEPVALSVIKKRLQNQSSSKLLRQTGVVADPLGFHAQLSRRLFQLPGADHSFIHYSQRTGKVSRELYIEIRGLCQSTLLHSSFGLRSSFSCLAPYAEQVMAPLSTSRRPRILETTMR